MIGRWIVVIIAFKKTVINLFDVTVGNNDLVEKQYLGKLSF